MQSHVNWMFLDLNSYFAGVEQELQPQLRGQPIAVVPIESESACCIAISSQAKAYGIQTGMALNDARVRCPHLIAVNARPRLYVEMHHNILDAIQRCVPVQQVMSCDEFAIRLLGRERQLERAVEIAYAIKQELRKIGATLRCSIGLGPSRLLAKIAADMQKPDGLMVLERHALPGALFALDLADIPGIGRRMEKRLWAEGVRTVRQLCALSRDRMRSLWGSVHGDRLWLLLQGEDLLEPEIRPLQSLSRQHILPPASRTRETAKGIAVKLLLSSARKMRRYELWTKAMVLRVGYQEGRAYEVTIQFPPTQDAFTLQAFMGTLFDQSPELTPSDLTVVLADLAPAPERGLFDAETSEPANRATQVIDRLNARYGLNTVYPGSIHAVRKEAPTRIAFGPPPPLEEFDDPADPVRTTRKSVRKEAADQEPYRMNALRRF